MPRLSHDWFAALSEAKSGSHGIRESRYRDTLFNLFEFYCARKRFDLAEKLIEMDMKNYAASEFVNSAIVKVSTEQVEDALFLSSDIGLLSSSLLQHGKTQEALTTEERGLAILKRCREKNIGQAQRLKRLGEWYQTAGQKEKARDRFKQALELLSGLPDDFKLKSEILVKKASGFRKR